VDETLPKVLPELARQHALTQQGIPWQDLSRAPWRDASDQVEDLFPAFLRAVELCLQLDLRKGMCDTTQ
jgi:hypothetical protein